MSGKHVHVLHVCVEDVYTCYMSGKCVHVLHACGRCGHVLYVCRGCVHLCYMEDVDTLHVENVYTSAMCLWKMCTHVMSEEDVYR